MVGSYGNDTTAGAKQSTSDRQELKRIQCAGQECTLTSHSVQTVRQPNSKGAISWDSFTGAGDVFPTAMVSKVFGTNYRRANKFLALADYFAMFTDRKQPLSLSVMRMLVRISQL